MGKKKADASTQPRQSSVFNRTGTTATTTQPNTGISPLSNSSLGRIFRHQPSGAPAIERASLTGDLNSQYTASNDRFNTSADAAQADYAKMMAGLDDWRTNSLNPLQASIDAHKPTIFNANRGKDTAYEIAGYKNFAETGGYSPQDIQELRARGISPIRAAYANAMTDVDRSTALQGGYGPNRIAAQSKMQRELPGQLADATTNVNAGLADAIRQGKLAGLGGMTGITEAEANRKLQAAGMTEDAYNQWRAQQMGMRELDLKGHGTQASLYGTTPGMADMFGRQAISAGQQRLSAQEQSDAYRIAQLRDKTDRAGQNKQFWSSVIGSVMKSDKNLKENITEFDPEKVKIGLKKLPISTWNYKGDTTKHIGPMAQDFKKYFGVGDGRTIHAVDIMGVMLASRKAELVKHG